MQLVLFSGLESGIGNLSLRICYWLLTGNPLPASGVGTTVPWEFSGLRLRTAEVDVLGRRAGAAGVSAVPSRLFVLVG